MNVGPAGGWLVLLVFWAAWIWLYICLEDSASWVWLSVRSDIYFWLFQRFLYCSAQVPVPWFQIMLSPAVWAIIVGHFCNNWGNYTMLTCMPTYFKQALGLALDNVRKELRKFIKATLLYGTGTIVILLRCCLVSQCHFEPNFIDKKQHNMGRHSNGLGFYLF